MFIQLTRENGKRVLCNTRLVKAFTDLGSDNGTHIAGLNTATGFIVKESYNQVVNKLTQLRIDYI